ncbi:MAG TPA: inositol monophosphatase family protein [bacterium]|nr:inositol monophosphatase family protein [bacterium]
MLDLLHAAVAAARAGGGVLRERFGSPGRIRMKAAGAGPVSEADLASEDAILSHLRPTGIPILSEEAGGAASGRRWIVDPLDGTGNFIRRLPWFGVAVALASNDDVELGVVYTPMADELFAAARGRGATLNGAPVHVSETMALVESCVFTSIDRGLCANPVRIRRFVRAAERVAEMRSPNAALVDMAQVSAGRADAFWEDGLPPWDMAAGSILVEEAGGAVSGLDGGRLRLEGRSIVASNGRVHAALVAVLGE